MFAQSTRIVCSIHKEGKRIFINSKKTVNASYTQEGEWISRCYIDYKKQDKESPYKWEGVCVFKTKLVYCGGKYSRNLIIYRWGNWEERNKESFWHWKLSNLNTERKLINLFSIVIWVSISKIAWEF